MTGGAEHPFVAVHALARADGLGAIDHLTVYDGALQRLSMDKPPVVFRLKTDPASALDRQRFDYHDHVILEPDTPAAMLAAIRSHIAALSTRPQRSQR